MSSIEPTKEPASSAASASGAKRCPKCHELRPIGDWKRRANGKLYGECQQCSAAKTTAFLAGPDLSPQAVFRTFRSYKPKGILHLIERDGARACGLCFLWFPPEQFRKIYRNGKQIGLAWICRSCRIAQVRRYEASDPERYAKYRKSSRELTKRRKAIGKEFIGRHGKPLRPVDIDLQRKLFIQHPPELETEKERAAYALGFMAGAQRSQRESERFDRLKDLCHRVASDGKFFGHRYEERLSAAYEGLLAFMRRSTRTKRSLEEERKVAAKAIRFALSDDARATGPGKKTGTRRYTEAIGWAGEEEPEKAAPTVTSSTLEAIHALDLPDRTKEILKGITEGYTYRELGERFGIGESRACMIANDLRKTHPELEDLLLAAVE